MLHDNNFFDVAQMNGMSLQFQMLNITSGTVVAVPHFSLRMLNITPELNEITKSMKTETNDRNACQLPKSL